MDATAHYKMEKREYRSAANVRLRTPHTIATGPPFGKPYTRTDLHSCGQYETNARTNVIEITRVMDGNKPRVLNITPNTCNFPLTTPA